MDFVLFIFTRTETPGLRGIIYKKNTITATTILLDVFDAVIEDVLASEVIGEAAYGCRVRGAATV